MNVLNGLGRSQDSMKTFLVGAAGNVIFNAMLIPIWGIKGAALGTAGSYLAMFITSTVLLKKKIKYSFEWISIRKIAIINIVLLAFVLFLRKSIMMDPFIKIIIVGILAGLLYWLFVGLFKLLDVKDLLSHFKGKNE